MQNKQLSQIDTVVADIYSVRKDFEACLVADSEINFDKEAQFAVQVLTDKDNSYALNIATSTPAGRNSTISAVKNIASIGLSLNPARKQAYLVPRKGKICLDISYQGLVDIAVQSGSIRWAQSRIVHDQDFFEITGVDKEPTHRFQPFGNRGKPVGVYVTVKTIDGDYLTESMSVDEVNLIRDKSESFKKNGSGPWRDFWQEMAKKTVVKRAQKYWPKTDRLSDAIRHLNEDVGEGIETANDMKNDLREKWCDRADASKSVDELREEMRLALKECKNSKDTESWEHIKSYFLDRLDILQNTYETTYEEKHDYT